MGRDHEYPQVLLDVNKAIQQPEIIEVAEAIDSAPGVAGVNITVTEIDVQTIRVDITVEGDNIDIGALSRPIESLEPWCTASTNWRLENGSWSG